MQWEILMLFLKKTTLKLFIRGLNIDLKNIRFKSRYKFKKCLVPVSSRHSSSSFGLVKVWFQSGSVLVLFCFWSGFGRDFKNISGSGLVPVKGSTGLVPVRLYIWKQYPFPVWSSYRNFQSSLVQLHIWLPMQGSGMNLWGHDETVMYIFNIKYKNRLLI